MRLRIGKRANADLDEIWLYLARESGSSEIATRAVGRIARAFDLLLRFPHAGRSCGSSRNPDRRSYASGDYLVYYCADKGILQILRVIHARRNLGSIL